MKLKKQKKTIYLQRARLPVAINLKEYSTIYTKLVKKYGSKNVRFMDRGYYLGTWLVETRLETTAELAKRQKTHDDEIAKRQALAAKWRAEAKVRRAQRRKEELEAQKVAKKQEAEQKVIDAAQFLKLAGYKIVKTRNITT